jgi:hypothetical protein
MTQSMFKTSTSHGFACSSSQAMCRVKNEHLTWCDLRKTRASGGTWYPCNSVGSRFLNVRQAKAICRVTMVLRTDHTWENP